MDEFYSAHVRSRIQLCRASEWSEMCCVHAVDSCTSRDEWRGCQVCEEAEGEDEDWLESGGTGKQYAGSQGLQPRQAACPAS
jgi:hypothetical protein